MPSVLWRCWLGGRKGIRPVKTEWWGAGVVICWSEVQTRIWPSWCHCHSLSLAPVKSRLVWPFWYRLTQFVLEKRPLNGCCCCYWGYVRTQRTHPLPTGLLCAVCAQLRRLNAVGVQAVTSSWWVLSSSSASASSFQSPSWFCWHVAVDLLTGSLLYKVNSALHPSEVA